MGIGCFIIAGICPTRPSNQEQNDMTNNLAQRAADELRREAYNCNGVDLCNPEKTVSRLLARIDELEARTKRRSEPMPEPVPEWLRRLSVAEMQKDLGPKLTSVWPGWTIARMIWERGDAEPVDPVEALAEDIQAEHGFLTVTAGVMVREAIKRGMELAKEIG